MPKNSKDLFFSIVIPSLNEEKYLPKLLEDLAAQTYSDFEVIVVDGNSKDETVKRSLEFKKSLLSLEVISSKERNVSHQRNLGAKKAKGKWIIFMDADNRIPGYFLDGIKYRILKENPQCFTTYSIADSKKPSDVALVKFINFGMEVMKLSNSPKTQGALMGVKNELYRKYRGFNEKMVFAEDSDYIGMLYKKGIDFTIFKDPRYTVSLRHYRRDGKLRYFGKIAKLNLKSLAGLKIDQISEYPMGGSYGEKKELNGLTDFFQEIKVALKKPKILRKIKEYLSYLEEEM